MNYVAHDCRNSRLDERSKNYCNHRWIDVDMTGATTLIPTWKYCRECCEKLGIDFEKQKPSDYYSKELFLKKQKMHTYKNKTLNPSICTLLDFASLTPRPSQGT